MAFSPIITDGDLQLSSSGDLQDAPDIKTQMPVTLGAYKCLYNTSINSQVIPYITSIPSGGFNRNTLTNYVASAYKILITPKLIGGLNIAVGSPVGDYVPINIDAIDLEGNQVKFSWTNPTNR